VFEVLSVEISYGEWMEEKVREDLEILIPVGYVSHGFVLISIRVWYVVCGNF
jgi:hypothetical protein